MSMFTRRIASAVLATALIGSFAVEQAAFAQAPTVGPAGGVATTTAPSNSEGTPTGGTGTLGSTRVGPGPSTYSAAPAVTTPTGPAVRQRRARRNRRARANRRPVSQETGTQSQMGTNGSVPPATR